MRSRLVLIEVTIALTTSKCDRADSVRAAIAQAFKTRLRSRQLFQNAIAGIGLTTICIRAQVIQASEKHGATQQHRYSHTNDREPG